MEDLEMNFWSRHYEFFLTASHIVMIACLIFALKLSRGVHLELVAPAALLFAWVFHSRGKDELPCGSAITGEAIARPRPGFHPESQ
jgi:hypothetical protein